MVSNGQVNSVKLEGFMPEVVSSISRFVPVCGHLGLLPQTADCFGVRGNNLKDIERMKEEALRLQDAGCSFLVLEKVCVETAKYLSNILEIPTIGIGSGPFCDGQVLVWHDLLGLGLDAQPYKFVKQYDKLSTNVIASIENYVSDVKTKAFPTKDHSYFLSEKTRNQFQQLKGTNTQLGDFDLSTDFGPVPTPSSSSPNKPLLNKQAQTKVVASAKELRQYRSELEKNTKDAVVVFIPFLGGLHDGHLALVKHAKNVYPNAKIWTSLFLNPTQFNNVKDLETYPMNMQDDIRMLTDIGVDVIFTPSAQEMYPLAKELFRPFVDFYTLGEKVDEAKQRPGHFQGVGSVVTKLFAWVRPHKAIFGQKDFIQCILVTRLAQEFFPDLEIVVHPTVREPSGLAMSSRNNKLTPQEKQRAPLIYQILSVMATKIYLNSTSSDLSSHVHLTVKELRKIGAEFARNNNVELEYIAFHDPDTGFQLDDNLAIDGKNQCVTISIAGSVGKSTRLIDNIKVGKGVWDQFKLMKMY
ncbi:pantoate/beta-alanine ligase [Reticulomyxa filosa]|uniref:Pantoate--beta-alanine ligase n=1 Tax=Reticulomyxa filosa TaxID=46433 RepID=X6NUR5_RETFI|nr:pantoate/beta-alanine ligase [Reticulomyxa filosa]|eukprot:ETO29761.1 pantoate/beta-alanine ligase [Reticulomyxa filosa]